MRTCDGREVDGSENNERRCSVLYHLYVTVALHTFGALSLLYVGAVQIVYKILNPWQFAQITDLIDTNISNIISND